MTQLLIAGVEVTLPQNFSVTVKRENSFFTKNGEYTYDCTLRLDNPTNRTLYGFLQRLNKTDQLDTKRTAVLIADGHVYARGTEIITRWTQESVTIQIVSGESELNYVIGSDKLIEDLDLGSINPTSDLHCWYEDGMAKWYDGAIPVYSENDWDNGFCFPPIRTKAGRLLNFWNYTTEVENDAEYEDDNDNNNNYHTLTYCANLAPQPYLCYLLESILYALGYNQYEPPVNQLKSSSFGNLFIVNTITTLSYSKMLPGWTVSEFLEEVEKLTSCVFVVDNLNMKCDILLKNEYYLDSQAFTVRNVIDEYEVDHLDDEGRTAEWSASDVSYDIPDHHWAGLMKLPEGVKDTATINEYVDLQTLIEAAGGIDYKSSIILKDTSTGRMYIKMVRFEEWASGTEENLYLLEVDQFCNLDRENNESTLELKITPAPMRYSKAGNDTVEIVDFSDEKASSESQSQEENEDETYEDVIRGYSEEKSDKTDLYCAFHNGAFQDRTNYKIPVAYTDAYHAIVQGSLRLASAGGYPPAVVDLIGETPSGSLRLKDIDTELFTSGFVIDTSRPTTFETYDPNKIDPRQVYVIKNRRFVCRDIEEVITSSGRQKKWKATFFPISITDTTLESRWILTDGVWDDGGVWLDDGRWNDNPQ